MYVVVSVFNFAIFFLFFNPIFPEFLNAFDDSVTYVHGFKFVVNLFSLVSSFVEAAEGVSDNFAFDVLIDRTVGVEGWGVIDFDKDGREILLEHYVEAEDGEAHVVFDVVGFDIMLKQDLTPILIEVNHAPSFNSDSPIDEYIKSKVIRDAFCCLYKAGHKAKKIYHEFKSVDIRDRVVKGVKKLREDRVKEKEKYSKIKDAYYNIHKGG
jgi:hypothetical protein